MPRSSCPPRGSTAQTVPREAGVSSAVKRAGLAQGRGLAPCLKARAHSSALLTSASAFCTAEGSLAYQLLTTSCKRAERPCHHPPGCGSTRGVVLHPQPSVPAPAGVAKPHTSDGDRPSKEQKKQRPRQEWRAEPAAPRRYLEQVAGQASLPRVHQQQVIAEGLGKTIRHRDLLHLHPERQLGLRPPDFNARHEPAHLVLPTAACTAEGPQPPPGPRPTCQLLPGHYLSSASAPGAARRG